MESIADARVDRATDIAQEGEPAETGDIAAGSRKAGDEAGANRVSHYCR
jgi:hypothetical protein